MLNLKQFSTANVVLRYFTDNNSFPAYSEALFTSVQLYCLLNLMVLTVKLIVI